MPKTNTPAKIACPDPADSYPRARLFKWLDRARSRRCIWVMGPPGAGKTTLVAQWLARQPRVTLWIETDAGDSDAATFFHYLSLAAHKALPRRRRPFLPVTAQRLNNLDAFAREYFRDLYSSFTKPFVLVLDNLHDLAHDSQTLQILRIAIEALPDNGLLIGLSRTNPPASLARLRLNGNIEILDDRALRLTVDEALGLASRQLPNRPTRSQIANLHELTHGWTAGLVLLLEQTDLKVPQSAAPFKTPGVLFEYFASEVFDKSDADTRNVLLKSVFLPTMTARQAVTLSGERRAGRLLTQLSRSHFFTIRYDLPEPVFQYHPLFREFLRSRATRLLDRTTLSELRHNAATLLEAAGNFEAALDLLEEEADWDGYGRCLSSQASQLLDEGRHEALQHWLARLPPEELMKSPWLRYWDASARLTRHPAEGRASFEQAMTAFAQAGDAHGARLAWCNIVSSIVHEGARFDALNEWIDRFKALPVPKDGRAGNDAPVTASMLAALALTRPQHPDTTVWAEHATTLLLSRAEINKRLGAGVHLLYFHLYRGEMTRAATIAGRLNDALRAQPASPLMELMTHISTSFHHWLSADARASLNAAELALALGERAGIRLWDHYIYGHAAAAMLTDNDLDGAQAWIDRLAMEMGSARPLDAAFYHLLVLWRALLRGDLSMAREQLVVLREYERSLGLWFGEIGIYQAEAQIELAAGNPEAAGEPIRRLLAGAHEHGSRRYLFIGNLLKAQMAFDQHRDTEGISSLTMALTMGREERLVNFHGLLPRVIARLCARALDAGIETEHVRSWIALRALPLPDEARDLESWPWPIRIYTLGRLSIVNHDKPLKFSGRAQSRPLELLAALIALGGRSVAEEVLSEALWPDAEGDAAHRAFEITLHRLRKLLGCEEALVLSDSKLSLNPALCWVDVWSLERQLGRLESMLRESKNDDRHLPLHQLGKRLLTLYRGAFLGSGEKSPWAVAARERMQSRFLCSMNSLAHFWEQHGHWNDTVDIYQRAIDVQGYSEEYYQSLMQAYLNLQRPSEAMVVYRRACQTLATSAGQKPSASLESSLLKIQAALVTRP